MSDKKIEEVINGVLIGDAQKNLLDLVAHLQVGEDSDFSIARNTKGDDALWLTKKKDESVGVIFISGSDEFPGPWTMWVDGDPIGAHENFPIDQHVKEAAWENIAPCGSCGGECSPGFSKTVFGKKFDNVCNSTLMFTNPGVSTLEYLKKIVDVRKNDIINS